MKVAKVLGAIVSIVAVSVGSIGLGATEVKAQYFDEFFRSLDNLQRLAEERRYLMLRECSLYGTQEAAQANYHIGTDIDQDGLACEHLPSRSYYAPSVSSRQYHSSACTLRPDTNIRSGPSVESAVIANETTLLSDAIEIHSSEIGRDGQYWSWIGFQGSDGRTAGWVRSDFIQPCS